MPGPNLENYVDVPERIRRFKAEFPDGYLTGRGEFVRDAGGNIVGYLYRAEARASVETGRMGVGTAFEPIPGKTPFTRDSEVMNCETSAWGRAIQALGFDFGAVASAEEVRNRSDVLPARAKAERPADSSARRDALMDETTDLIRQYEEARGVAEAREAIQLHMETRMQKLTRAQMDEGELFQLSEWLKDALSSEAIPFG